MTNNVFGAFPELKVEHGDVSGGWNKFEEEFVIAAKLKHLELGEDVFTDNTQLLALCKTVEQEGRNTLK